MSDFLLELSKNPQARSAIKSIGLPIPLPDGLQVGLEERPSRRQILLHPCGNQPRRADKKQKKTGGKSRGGFHWEPSWRSGALMVAVF